MHERHRVCTASLEAPCARPSTGIDAAQGVQRLTAGDRCEPLFGAHRGHRPVSTSAARGLAVMVTNPTGGCGPSRRTRASLASAPQEGAADESGRRVLATRPRRGAGAPSGTRWGRSPGQGTSGGLPGIVKVETGFHALDGACHLRALGHERLAGLVAYHSGGYVDGADLLRHDHWPGWRGHHLGGAAGLVWNAATASSVSSPAQCVTLAPKSSALRHSWRAACARSRPPSQAMTG